MKLKKTQTFERLASNIIDWADEKHLFDSPNPAAQFGKTMEELAEMYQEFLKFNEAQYDLSMPEPETFLQNLALELGDVLVTLIIFSEMLEIDLVAALEAAYNKIKDRTGKTVNGVFIKDNYSGEGNGKAETEAEVQTSDGC